MERNSEAVAMSSLIHLLVEEMGKDKATVFVQKWIDTLPDSCRGIEDPPTAQEFIGTMTSNSSGC